MAQLGSSCKAPGPQHQAGRQTDVTTWGLSTTYWAAVPTLQKCPCPGRHTQLRALTLDGPFLRGPYTSTLKGFICGPLGSSTELAYTSDAKGRGPLPLYSFAVNRSN